MGMQVSNENYIACGKVKLWTINLIEWTWFTTNIRSSCTVTSNRYRLSLGWILEVFHELTSRSTGWPTIQSTWFKPQVYWQPRLLSLDEIFLVVGSVLRVLRISNSKYSELLGDNDQQSSNPSMIANHEQFMVVSAPDWRPLICSKFVQVSVVSRVLWSKEAWLRWTTSARISAPSPNGFASTISGGAMPPWVPR